MTIAQQRIAETINQVFRYICLSYLSQFYDESSNLAGLANSYKAASISLDEQTRADLDQDFRNTVLNPLQQFSNL